MFSRQRCCVLVIVLCLAAVGAAVAADEPALSKAEMEEFLRTAQVIKSKDTSKGITHPYRLTLSDGKITHDASFQPVDEHKTEMKFDSGRSEMNFVDSYKYNIAAYRLAELLGVDDMMPVYVERKWQGNSGSLSWWLPVKMDEQERLKQKMDPPDADAWNNQMYRIRVFDELVADTDANLTNVLIGENWKIWRVDFTRAFRLQKDVLSYKNLVRCDRDFFQKLKDLDPNQAAAQTKGYLNKEELKAVMARRDKIVAQFNKMITEKGENNVLYQYSSP